MHCNRTLCNGNSTLKAVKELMFKYNITKTLDGRLNDDGSTFIISISLIIIMTRIRIFSCSSSLESYSLDIF